ncbi:DUF1758 domain-containing protein [Trichonephila clavipes]|nr:DUF1758 domain-containing protein [Trichonephila clavipes]
MEKVEEHFDETTTNNICYYLPHHRVFRPDKTTTKLRVVFNGSASTTSAKRDLLRIMWKTGANEEPIIYRLKTVTYGTDSVSFLAIRTLKQLAMDEASRFSLGSKEALQDVYMDDIVSDQEHSFSTSAESAIKTLGISWKPTGDYFMFKILIPSVASYTKRDVLSVIARFYDPLGLIGPVISKAKIFLQKLWLRKLNWEHTILPGCNRTRVAQFRVISKSPRGTQNRSIHSYRFHVKVMLLGYADASGSEYGAVVYTGVQKLRTKSKN